MGAEVVGDQRAPLSAVPPPELLDAPESVPLLPPEPPELEPPELLDPPGFPELVAPELDPLPPPELDPLPPPELPGPCEAPGPPSLAFVSAAPGSVVPPPPEQPNAAARQARQARRTARTRGSSAIMDRRAASDV